jgi:hypothetical protein
MNATDQSRINATRHAVAECRLGQASNEQVKTDDVGLEAKSSAAGMT